MEGCFCTSEIATEFFLRAFFNLIQKLPQIFLEEINLSTRTSIKNTVLRILNKAAQAAGNKI